MRRDVGGEPDPTEYQEKQTQLEEIKQLESAGKINLYYLDETGFCLISSVLYGWQNIREYLTIKSCRSTRLNVLEIIILKPMFHHKVLILMSFLLVSMLSFP